MNQNIQVIYCSPNRCDDCPNRKEALCKSLTTKRIEPVGPIILVEKQRGLLHISHRNSFPVNEPPWYSDGWDSIFIGVGNELFEDLENLIEIYPVEPYVSLFFRHSDYHARCEYLPIIKTALEFSLLNSLAKESRKIIGSMTPTRKVTNKKLDDISKIISNYIQRQIPEINDITRTRLAQVVAHKSHILGSLYPILLDELTEEVYFDGPGTNIYFDHQKMGRCTTSISFSNSEVPRIITFVRFESNLHLDRSNPSLKMDLDLFNTNLRLSISIPPLSVDGLHLEIRRAKKKPYLIRDLIENDTMTYEAAALLLLALACRFNITITGGPSTGKTTILNALDMATPRFWRKVYIEDTIESRKLYNHHQVRLQVDPIDEQQSRLSKSEEIVKCLHRSPDYVILGEIQTEEHSRALFQAIAAGLHSLQTCHGDSAAGLVSRWITNHGINRTSLGLMDLIITLERPKPGESRRHIKEITEIRKGVQDGVLTFLGINTIYESETNTRYRLAKDGAFSIHAKNNGIEDPENVIKLLVRILQNNEKHIDFETILERLWIQGHPMKFIA
ncbi:hypothetical protein EU527_00290 [Candidatus Thorarchaeota archaeon]|nr:MAG: hypothetical protein EU527_00290 [Candidatus Thorarchaeota archaeon]